MYTYMYTAVLKIIGVLPYNIFKVQIFYCGNLQNMLYPNGSYNGM